NHAIQHCRIDGGQPIAAFPNSFNHPALRYFKRAPPQMTNAKWLEKFQGVIEAKKEIAPGPKLLTTRQPQIGLLSPQRIELVQLLVPGQNARGLEMINDTEWQKHRANPR